MSRYNKLLSLSLNVIVWFHMYFVALPASSTVNAGCDSGDVRLANFTDDPDEATREGTLQICINNAWGTVCSDPRFALTEAQVACQQAGGFRRELSEEMEPLPTSGPVFLSELNCMGDEASLLECPRFVSIGSECSSGLDVTIRCTGKEVISISIT